MTTSAATGGTGPAAPDGRRARRLVGVDVARFVAVFGMFNIHFGVPFLDGSTEHWISWASSGRSTALFTFLAGVSLAMMSGRRVPLTGAALRSARLRIALRAMLLIVLGIALAKATEATGFLLTVIIAFYGVYFLLVLPFTGMRARGVAIAAAAVALAGPQVSFVLRTWIAGDTPLAGFVGAVNSVDPGHLVAGLGIFDLLLLSFYPAASYLALVLAGMAVGRLDLRSGGVRFRLATAGAALASVTYTSSEMLVGAAGGLPAFTAEGSVPVDRPVGLLAATPHSGTTFEIAGSLGVAVVMLVLCLELTDRAGRLLALPAAAGSMALTLYAVHALVMAWQIVVGGWPLSGVPEDLAELATMGPALPDLPGMPAFPEDGRTPVGAVAFVNIYMSEIFLIASLLFAAVWRRLFGKGPLEAALSGTVRRIACRIEDRFAASPGTAGLG